jgi:hypothetical protein
MKLLDKMRQKIKRIDYLILIAYLILTVIVTYPVAFFGEKIPGAGDVYWFLWDFWWFKTALLSFCSPYYTPYLFYPTGVTLAFSTVTPFNAILSVPLQSAFGLINAYKILWIFTFIASGYGTYLLVKYLTDDTGAAFISGLIFMFCPYHFAHALGHMNLTSIEWIPFYVLFLIKTVKENNRSNAIYAAIFLFLTTISCYYYLIYLLVFTLLYLVYYLWAEKYNIQKKDFLKRLSIMVITFGLIFSPFAYPILKEILIAKSSYMYASGFVTYSADFLGFFIPSLFHPLFKGLVAPLYQNFTGNLAEYTVFAGYTVIFLALISILKVKKKEILFWLLSAITFFILCLGPILHVNGIVSIACEGYNICIPLPYLVLMRIPIISIARVPSRWDILVMLSLAVLAGYGLNYIFTRINGKIFNKISKKHVLAVVFSCLILFEFLAIPYPMSSAKVPDFYYSMAKDPEDYAILELPNFAPHMVTSEFMYYQTIHEKKLVCGYVSRIPNYAIKFSNSAPFINRLVYLSRVNTTIPIPREDILNQNTTEIGSSVLNYYNIRYIILHKGYMTSEQLEFAIDLLDKTLKSEPKTFGDGNLIVYKVEDTVPERFMVIDEGWDALEKWNDGPGRWMSNSSTIKVISPKNEECSLSFETGSLYQERDLYIYANGALIEKYHIDKIGYPDVTPTRIELKIKINVGENAIRFYTPQKGTVPSKIGAWKDDRVLSLTFQNITLTSLKKNYDVDFVDYSIPDSIVVNSFYSSNITIENTGAEKWEKK